MSETLTLSKPSFHTSFSFVTYVELFALKNPLALPGVFSASGVGCSLLIFFLPGAEVNREALVKTYDKPVGFSIHLTHIAL